MLTFAGKCDIMFTYLKERSDLMENLSEVIEIDYLTLGDCENLYSQGWQITLNNGRVTNVEKEND